MALGFNHFYRCPFCRTGHVSPHKFSHRERIKCHMCFHPLRFEQTDAVPVDKVVRHMRIATPGDAGTYVAPERYEELRKKYGAK